MSEFFISECGGLDLCLCVTAVRRATKPLVRTL